jgi:hypothetical protein
MPGKVVESMVWKHASGRRASPYTAGPWNCEAERKDWSLVKEGYTVRHPDGTEGCNCPAFATREEAEAWIAANPHFPGYNQD